jgi:hypothetical protein
MTKKLKHNRDQTAITAVVVMLFSMSRQIPSFFSFIKRNFAIGAEYMLQTDQINEKKQE